MVGGVVGGAEEDEAEDSDPQLILSLSGLLQH